MEILVVAYIFPIVSYFLAHRMPNKKSLTIYSYFWLTLAIFVVYDFIANTSSSNGDNDLSLGWLLITVALQLSCYAALIGIVGRAIVLYLKHQGTNIKMLTVNFLSFFTLITLPTLIYLLILLIYM